MALIVAASIAISLFVVAFSGAISGKLGQGVGGRLYGAAGMWSLPILPLILRSHGILKFLGGLALIIILVGVLFVVLVGFVVYRVFFGGGDDEDDG